METPNYKVSPQTAGIVSAYDLLSKVYDKVYESLNLIYDEKTALEVIDRDFMPGLHSLEDAIMKMLYISVKERRGDMSSDEIWREYGISTLGTITIFEYQWLTKRVHEFVHEKGKKCYSDTPFLGFWEENMEQCKYPRGKEIFEEYKNRLNCPDISEDERAYYSDIINAVDMYSYDVPIPMQKMYEALEKAERQGKQIQIVPDSEFLGGGKRSGQCDGWSYHIELI